MARHLARLGISSSFYLLPSTSYYFKSHITRQRSPELLGLLYSLILTGCEIGLHNNAFEYGEDGPKVVKDEIKWLNSVGAHIKGTVAHNTLASYKAENYEIFKERVLFPRKTKQPIGRLSERKLGLTYEGTFTKPSPHLTPDLIEEYVSATPPNVQSEAWMKRYLHENPYHEWLMDYQFWLIGVDQWVITSKETFKWKVGLEDVIKTIKECPPDTNLIFVIHPDYFQKDPLTSNYPASTPSTSTILKELKKLVPIRIKRLIKSRNKIERINAKFTELRLRLYNLTLRIIPYRTRWERAQRKYYDWSATKISLEYLIEIRKMGRRFATFVGPYEICLDIGSGNGLYNGVTYDEAGYRYLENTEISRVIGLDPLPLEAPKPSWIHDYVMAVGEYLPFCPEVFDIITIATSFDHLLDPKKTLEECASVSNGELFLWTTCVNKGGPNEHHANRLTRDETIKIVEKSPFTLGKYHVDQKYTGAEVAFIKAVK